MGMSPVSVVLPYTRGQHGPVASAAGGSGQKAWTSPTPGVGLVGRHSASRKDCVVQQAPFQKRTLPGEETLGPPHLRA